MVAKLTRLIHKIAIQLHLVAESCSRWPVWKLLDTPSYVWQIILHVIMHNFQLKMFNVDDKDISSFSASHTGVNFYL